MDGCEQGYDDKRYNPWSYPGTWQEYGQRIVENVRAGEQPHGGNIAYLMYHDPESGQQTIKDVLDEIDKDPEDVEELASLLEWEDGADQEEFVERYSGLDL